VTGGPYTITFSSAFLAANTVTAVTSSATGLTAHPGTVTVAADGVQMAEGTALNPAASLPMDIASAFKPGF
jgi:metal-dependent HD superfamily phosphatase/phosphodiesterase